MDHSTKWELASEGMSAPAARSFWVVRGMLLAGGYPSSAKPDEERERLAMLWNAGIRTFVNLVEEEEQHLGAALRPYWTTLAELTARTSERAACIRMPIRDVSVTSVDSMRSILDLIDLSLAAGRPAYVHCLGGIGRTGMVIGCWLRRHDLASKADVLATLKRLRIADAARAHIVAPETNAQREMVLAWNE